MKIILFALVIVFAVSGACNPPQSTTNPSSDTTATNKPRDTSVSPNTRDTGVAPQRDTGMDK
jgi:hypothetical protein